jgi:hypothetical protein
MSPACSSSSGTSTATADGSAPTDGSADSGGCGTSGVFSGRFVNLPDSGGGCVGDFSGAVDTFGGYGLTSGGFNFACTLTGATSTCPAHLTETCGASNNASGATAEFDVDANNAVAGVVVVMFTEGPCSFSFTGTRDPNG